VFIKAGRSRIGQNIGQDAFSFYSGNHCADFSISRGRQQMNSLKPGRERFFPMTGLNSLPEKA
jgi:hypothetical protein